MKRYRIVNYFIDATRNILNYPDEGVDLRNNKIKVLEWLQNKYGSNSFEQKLNRYNSLNRPELSLIGEYAHLLNDAIDSFVFGSLYSSLTASCCLGERILNDILLKTREYYKSSRHYKSIYRVESINDWIKAIDILKDWGIFDDVLKKLFKQMNKLRQESVHYQNKEQDLESMSLDALGLINDICRMLFGVTKEKKNILLWFDVPGEIYIKKDAEKIPFVKEFYLPSSVYVGFKHRIKSSEGGVSYVEDSFLYENKEISDEEFIEMRKSDK